MSEPLWVLQGLSCWVFMSVSQKLRCHVVSTTWSLSEHGFWRNFPRVLDLIYGDRMFKGGMMLPVWFSRVSKFFRFHSTFPRVQSKSVRTELAWGECFVTAVTCWSISCCTFRRLEAHRFEADPRSGALRFYVRECGTRVGRTIGEVGSLIIIWVIERFILDYHPLTALAMTVMH